MKKKKKPIPGLNQDGFTLIEVIVALAIITVGILSVNVMQLVSVRGNHTASGITSASTWAADQIEQIFGMDYDDGNLVDAAGTNGGVAGLDDVAPADGNAVSPDNNYTIYWNVADDVPMDNIKTIRIIVTRNERGVMKSVTMDYMKSPNV